MLGGGLTPTGKSREDRCKLETISRNDRTLVFAVGVTARSDSTKFGKCGVVARTADTPDTQADEPERHDKAFCILESQEKFVKSSLELKACGNGLRTRKNKAFKGPGRGMVPDVPGRLVLCIIKSLQTAGPMPSRLWVLFGATGTQISVKMRLYEHVPLHTEATRRQQAPGSGREVPAVTSLGSPTCVMAGMGA